MAGTRFHILSCQAKREVAPRLIATKLSSSEGAKREQALQVLPLTRNLPGIISFPSILAAHPVSDTLPHGDPVISLQGPDEAQDGNIGIEQSLRRLRSSPVEELEARFSIGHTHLPSACALQDDLELSEPQPLHDYSVLLGENREAVTVAVVVPDGEVLHEQFQLRGCGFLRDHDSTCLSCFFRKIWNTSSLPGSVEGTV